MKAEHAAARLTEFLPTDKESIGFRASLARADLKDCATKARKDGETRLHHLLMTALVALDDVIEECE